MMRQNGSVQRLPEQRRTGSGAHDAPPTRQSFKVQGMCCAEEVGRLKREVGPVAGGEDRLSFDLLNSKMTVRAGADDRAPATAEIVRAVQRAGLTAIPWSEHLKRPAREESFGARYGRTVACAVSGVCFVVGFAWHAVRQESVWVALTGAGMDESYLPSAGAVILLGASIVSGLWYVAPKALMALRRLRPDMNLLMVTAIAGAVILGEWLEGAMVSFLFALALQLEAWSVGRARRAVEALMQVTPAKARFRVGKAGAVTEAPVERVPVGATVLVRPGERIPLDGLVTRGETSVDQSPITGESAPTAKESGDEVYAGTINGEGAFEFECTRPADDTRLARIIHLVQTAQERRAPTEQWIERFARVYTPIMMGLAVAIAVVPPLVLAEPWLPWVYQALVLLVIACPCALVISTPVSIVAGLTSAARAGVLVKGGGFLERAGRIRAIAFDKTGTLTFGTPVVERIIPLEGHTETEVLARAAAMESHSGHPLARAIVDKAEESRVIYRPAEEFQQVPGKGAEARVGGRRFWIGSHRYALDRETGQKEYVELARRLETSGHSIVAVGTDDHICGVLTITDRLRSKTARVVRDLKKLGIERVEMLTGDNRWVAAAVGQRSGVDEVRAELLPEDKVEAVRALREEFGEVAMVGDGINDAPAMAESTLAVAMGAVGSDVAIETADVALMTDDLERIPWLVQHSRRTMRIIHQNVAFALGLKLIFVILALTGLATLWMAIAADMGATLIVIANAMRLLHDGKQEKAARQAVERELWRTRRQAA